MDLSKEKSDQRAQLKDLAEKVVEELKDYSAETKAEFVYTIVGMINNSYTREYEQLKQLADIQCQAKQVFINNLKID